MSTGPGSTPLPAPMRANRKVVETRCSICDNGFEFAENVYACPSCGAYHHMKCWDTWRSCERRAAETGDVPPQPEVGLAADTAPAAVPETNLKPDERECPFCRELIKKDALKCRHCGMYFDSATQRQLEEEKVPLNIASDIDKFARDSIIWASVGFLICAPVTGPVAISKGRSALKLLDQYPKYREQSSAGTKAKVGIAIAIISLVLLLIGVLGRVSKP